MQRRYKSSEAKEVLWAGERIQTIGGIKLTIKKNEVKTLQDIQILLQLITKTLTSPTTPSMICNKPNNFISNTSEATEPSWNCLAKTSTSLSKVVAFVKIKLNFELVIKLNGNITAIRRIGTEMKNIFSTIG